MPLNRTLLLWPSVLIGREVAPYKGLQEWNNSDGKAVVFVLIGREISPYTELHDWNNSDGKAVLSVQIGHVWA